MSHDFPNPKQNPLPGPFALRPSPDGPRAGSAVVSLVERQVDALLAASPAYHDLTPHQQHGLRRDMVKVASYSAALTQDEFAQSQRLGQAPLLTTTEVITPLLSGGAAPLAAAAATQGAAGRARALADSPPTPQFSPRAVSQLAQVTKQTLKAIAFPQFVADLIKGTYAAIIDASIRQMESYVSLLKNVAGTVDQFMSDNITDNQARDYLQGSHPDVFKVAVEGNKPSLKVREDFDDTNKPNFQQELGLSSDPDLSDENAEEIFVPAARRMLARQRQQVLATMVMMGINRIVITSGTITASMQFHIDASDTAQAASGRQSASEFDEKNETTAGVGGGLFSFFGGANIQTKNTVSYVSTEASQESQSASDTLTASADLSSQVSIKFKSDYLPMEKLATPEMIAAIQGNTINPATNAPPAKPGQTPAQPVAGAPAAH